MSEDRLIREFNARDYTEVSAPTGFEPTLLSAECCDQHFAAVDSTMNIRARCSVWWRETAALRGDAQYAEHTGIRCRS